MFFFDLSWLLWAIIINGLMAGWAYSDSKDRGDKDPGGWVAVIIVFGVFGLIYYLFKRPPRTQVTQTLESLCVSCGSRLSNEAEFCPKCGKKIVASPTTGAPMIASTQEKHVPRFWKIWIGVAIIAILFIVVFNVANRPSVVLVKIDHSGSWSGALGYDSSTRSIDGFGPAIYRIQLTGMRVVTAVIQKGSQYGTLTVSITTEDGRVLAKETTTAPYGVVTVSWRG